MAATGKYYRTHIKTKKNYTFNKIFLTGMIFFQKRLPASIPGRSKNHE